MVTPGDMSMADDKENSLDYLMQADSKSSYSNHGKDADPTYSLNKKGLSGAASGKNGRKYPRSKGTFGRLLSDVTNEQKIQDEEVDAKYAVETQVDDALEMATKWIREDEDAKHAAELEEKLKQEAKLERALEVSAGEQEALNVAIEERRRIQMEAQQKKDMEFKDADFAKQIVIEDANNEQDFKELCSKDDEKAKKLYLELQDEMLAEEIAKKEEDLYKAQEKERSELAMKQAIADFEYARKIQEDLDREDKDAKSEQERKDAHYALKATILTARDEHRRRKRLQLIHSPAIFNSIEKVIDQWLEADADVEDVPGGLCLTILLPYLRDVKIKAMDKNKVDLEAYRIVGRGEKDAGLTNIDNSQYMAEFVIEGKNVNITDNDVSFEYSSETGLLFIYIENVHLDEDDADVGDSTAHAKSRENSVKNSSASRDQKSGIVSSLKNGLKKLLWGGK
jgi:hypothetical protein